MAESFAPLRICDVDLSGPLPSIAASDPETGVGYGGVFCLVRSGGRPIAALEIPFRGEGLDAGALRDEIASRIGTVPSQPARPPVDPSALPPVAVVVATRDRPGQLAHCLDSLLAQDYPDFRIVVVDNAPATAETAELVASRYEPTGRVRYVRDDRPGLGQAHNRGLAESAEPVLAFTDDDVVADPRWLSAIGADFADGRVGCVTGLILPAELETRAQYWTERHGGFGKGFARRVFDLGENRPSGRLFPFAAGGLGSGANMAFSREALRRIGGFDAALGAGTLARGGDDLAAFASVVRAGFRLVYEPEAIVWHHHRRGEEGMRRQAYGYGVALGAYLTRMAVEDPSALLAYAAGLPSAAIHLFARSSDKNRRLPADYPAALVWRERLGILAGLPAYFRSRAALRRPVAPRIGGGCASLFSAGG